MAADIRALIRQMHAANPLWGAPRIQGELQKLGLTLSETTVAKYLGRRRSPPSPTWRTFLANHVDQLASVDFFTVPTATFRVLFVFVVLSHNRRRIVHLNVTAHPTAAWTAQQLREVWPWDTAPRFLVRDRDGIYGSAFQRVARAMGIDEVLAAPRAPWQNPFVERVIGSLRRECLDHVIVWNERSLRRRLQQYLAYYHDWCTHLLGGQGMHQLAGRSSQLAAAGSSRSGTSADCIITTNVAPPDRRARRQRQRAASRTSVVFTPGSRHAQGSRPRVRSVSGPAFTTPTACRWTLVRCRSRFR